MTSDEFLIRSIVLTFCAIMLMVFATLLVGLYSPSVDNREIFKMMGHDFDLMLVALTGYMGGRASAKAP